MLIVFLGDDDQWQELSKSIIDNEWIRVHSISEWYAAKGDIYLFLQDDVSAINFTLVNKPILINSVTKTLAQLNAPANVLRINGWQTFLQRPIWEIAGIVSNDIINALSSSFQKKLIAMPDDVGFASAKVVSMIINEAYFTLQDEVSSKEEIDIAMKLGTNYPYGPFEWASKIGVRNIYTLLNTLSQNEKRYIPSKLLKQEIGETNS
jgi:3-hydroxybutyryl-CoA dehydrogenase